MRVKTLTVGKHEWSKAVATADLVEYYYESNGTPVVDIADRRVAGLTDYVETDTASPSRPASSLELTAEGKGDDGFLDVIFHVDLP